MRTPLTCLFALVGAAVTTVPVSAQQPQPERAAFDGQWSVIDGARSSVASRGDGRFRTGDMGSGWGSPFTLAQTPGRVVIAFDPYSAYDLQAPVRFAYPLDGSEARNQEDMGFTTTVFTSRSAWKGSTLTTTDHFPVPPEVAGPGVTAEVRRTLTLVAADTLVIETTRVGLAGAPTVDTRTAYVRKR